MLDVVLDTNCLIASISRKGNYFPIWQGLRMGKYRLCVTTEILEEYEEIISKLTNEEVTNSVVQTLINLPNIRFITVFYHLDMITSDKDDNKFVDCAVAANAKYIVSEDAHFKHLNEHEFPYIPVIRINAFLKLLINM